MYSFNYNRVKSVADAAAALGKSDDNEMVLLRVPELLKAK